MSGRPWTMGDIRTLRALVATHTNRQIGAALGRSPGSVSQQVIRFRLHRPARGPVTGTDTRAAVLAGLLAGDRPAAIARRIGRSKSTVSAHAREFRRAGLVPVAQ